MERYEDHTIAHAIQAKYEKTKVNTQKHQRDSSHDCIFIYRAVVTWWTWWAASRCIWRYTSGLDQWEVECPLLVGLLKQCCTWLVSAMWRQRCVLLNHIISHFFPFFLKKISDPFALEDNDFIVFNLQIIGSRNPLNVIKALFIALNAVCFSKYTYP